MWAYACRCNCVCGCLCVCVRLHINLSARFFAQLSKLYTFFSIFLLLPGIDRRPSNATPKSESVSSTSSSLPPRWTDRQASNMQTI